MIISLCFDKLFHQLKQTSRTIYRTKIKIVTQRTKKCEAKIIFLHLIYFKILQLLGSAIVFNVESLVDFILATGDFSDPETRLPFSDQDLTEIDALVRIDNIYFMHESSITILIFNFYYS